jgi:predicted nucleic acid-binding protein
LANAADAQHADAVMAVLELHRRSEVLHVTPQVLVEFRSVATRPAAQNGLGLSAIDAEAQATGFEGAFPLLPETPDIFPAWKALVSALNVIGKQVHDARLVAICGVHGIANVLTFNVGHFVRLATYRPGVVVVHPNNV